MWTLKQLQTIVNETQAEINGRWVPARSINWRYRTFRTKIKEAWAVFTGKADCFIWPENQ